MRTFVGRAFDQCDVIQYSGSYPPDPLAVVELLTAGGDGEPDTRAQHVLGCQRQALVTENRSGDTDLCEQTLGISGNLKRPRRYDRRLLRVFYLAANNSIKTCPESRNYYDRKRSEGKRHSQTILCLARRRLNVLWAMQRDNTSYQPGLPRAA